MTALKKERRKEGKERKRKRKERREILSLVTKPWGDLTPAAFW